LKEGVPKRQIIVTGNTVVDALLETRDRVIRRPPYHPAAKRDLTSPIAS